MTSERLNITKKLMYLLYNDSLKITPVSSTSKEINFKLIKNDYVDLALIRENQNLNGLKFVCALYDEYLTFLTSDNKIQNPANYDFGLANYNKYKFVWHDPSLNKIVDNFDIKKIYKTYTKQKKNDGVLVFLEHPSQFFNEITHKFPLEILDVNFNKKFFKNHNVFRRGIIETDDYINLHKKNKNRYSKTKTYRVRVLLMANSNVHNKTIYTLLSYIYNNLKFFEELPYFKTMRALEMANPINKNVEIHPGAQQFYKNYFKNKIVDLGQNKTSPIVYKKFNQL